jgi:hypothetical protein
MNVECEILKKEKRKKKERERNMQRTEQRGLTQNEKSRTEHRRK